MNSLRGGGYNCLDTCRGSDGGSATITSLGQRCEGRQESGETGRLETISDRKLLA